MKRYVLDSSALFTFLEGTAGADRIEALLQDSLQGKQRLIMSVLSWGELLRDVCLREGPKRAQEKLAELEKLPLDLIELDLRTVQAAADLSTQHHIEYARCIPLALAQLHKAALITSSVELGKIDSRLSQTPRVSSVG